MVGRLAYRRTILPRSPLEIQGAARRAIFVPQAARSDMIRGMRGPWPVELGDTSAVAVEVAIGDAVEDVPRALGLATGRPTVALVGGAAGMSDSDMDAARSLLARSLVPVVELLDGIVVDGGTDAGIMRAVGAAREECRASFPLVGVVVRRLLRLDEDASEDAAPPERRHSHFVLVPGSDWGDESAWLAAIAGAVAEDAPSVTVLANGGDIAWQDAEASIAAGRPILALAGTGRTADVLAAAAEGEARDRRAAALVATGLVRTAPFDRPEAVTEALRRELGLEREATRRDSSA